MNRRGMLVNTGLVVSCLSGGCLDGVSTMSSSNNSTDTNDNINDKMINENPRIDKPPYSIERPEPPNDSERPVPPSPEGSDEWDENYLGEDMKTEPSLRFSTYPVDNDAVKISFDHSDIGHKDAYVVKTIKNNKQYQQLLDTKEIASDIVDQLTNVEFNETMLIVVGSRYVSSSIEYKWKRIEEKKDHIHLFGYYISPYTQNFDEAILYSIIEIPKPANSLDFARVSLTISTDERVHFNSTEGVVSVDR